MVRVSRQVHLLLVGGLQIQMEQAAVQYGQLAGGVILLHTSIYQVFVI